MYDTNNIFAKILRNEIPSKKVLETAHTMAIHDAFPKALIHILFIPKKPYINFHTFMDEASDNEISDFYKTINEVIRIQKLEESGYKLLVNTGLHGRQEVSHYHLHLLGGEGIKLQGF